jgi:hypothetical protein
LTSFISGSNDSFFEVSRLPLKKIKVDAFPLSAEFQSSQKWHSFSDNLSILAKNAEKYFENSNFAKIESKILTESKIFIDKVKELCYKVITVGYKT